MTDYIQLQDDNNNDTIHVYHHQSIPVQQQPSSQPTPSQQQLAELIQQQQQGSSIKALGRASGNCCARYWLSSGLLVLLCCAITLLGMGLMMAKVTFNRDKYPGKWHSDICHVPTIQSDPEYSTQFFSPCKRGFQCNICKIANTTLIYLDLNQFEREVMMDIVAHDITQDQCTKINEERAFNCVFHLQPNNQTESSPSPLIQSSNTASILQTIVPTINNDNKNNHQIKDEPTPPPPAPLDHTIQILAKDEYQLDHHSKIKQLRSAIIVFGLGLFLLSIYLFLVLYRCCLFELQRKFKCLRFLSPKFLCSWILYRCCFKRALEEELNKKPDLRNQIFNGTNNNNNNNNINNNNTNNHSNINNHTANGNIQFNGQNHNLDNRYNLGDDIWTPKADVIMDEGNDSHFQFDLDSTDDETALKK